MKTLTISPRDAVSYRNRTRAPLPSPNNCVAGLAGVLERYLDFAKGDAALYASIVLKRNGEGSADWVGSAAMKVLGTWMRMSQEGMAAALLTSETETWNF